MNLLYKAIIDKYPDKSDAAISRIMELPCADIGKIKNGEKMGIMAAKWMTEHHPGCEEIYINILAEKERRNKARILNQAAARVENKVKSDIRISAFNYPSPYPRADIALEDT